MGHEVQGTPFFSASLTPEGTKPRPGEATARLAEKCMTQLIDGHA